jgi:DNA-binding transcriptional ArsR family regulator
MFDGRVSVPLAPSVLAPGIRERATLLARFFRGIDEPARVLILQLLLEGEKSVSELVDLTGSPQGRVSTHLGCLRWCGFVASRREGKRVYYRIVDDRIRTLLCLGQEVMAEHAQEILACGIVSPDVPGAAIHLAEGEGGCNG